MYGWVIHYGNYTCNLCHFVYVKNINHTGGHKKHHFDSLFKRNPILILISQKRIQVIQEEMIDDSLVLTIGKVTKK